MSIGNIIYLEKEKEKKVTEILMSSTNEFSFSVEIGQSNKRFLTHEKIYKNKIKNGVQFVKKKRWSKEH